MKLLIDTNIPIITNQRDIPPVSSHCISECVRWLAEITNDQHILVLDSKWRIIKEYMNKLYSSGRPGVGDAFLKWVLTHQANPIHCELVMLHEQHERGFAEFPTDLALVNFDPSDRKFVATSQAHPDHPPILNASDTDWWIHREALEANGVKVKFLCKNYVRDVVTHKE